MEDTTAEKKDPNEKELLANGYHDQEEQSEVPNNDDEKPAPGKENLEDKLANLHINEERM